MLRLLGSSLRKESSFHIERDFVAQGGDAKEWLQSYSWT